MNGESFVAGLVIGIFLTGIAAFIMSLSTLYTPGEGRYYYPWYETESLCVQAEKQNCALEYKQVYVAGNRRYDYEQ